LAEELAEEWAAPWTEDWVAVRPAWPRPAEEGERRDGALGALI